VLPSPVPRLPVPVGAVPGSPPAEPLDCWRACSPPELSRDRWRISVAPATDPLVPLRPGALSEFRFVPAGSASALTGLSSDEFSAFGGAGDCSDAFAEAGVSEAGPGLPPAVTPAGEALDGE